MGQIVQQEMGQQAGECGTVGYGSGVGMPVVFAGTVVAVGEQTVAEGQLAEDELAEDQSDHHHLHLWKIPQEQSVLLSVEKQGSEQVAGAEGQIAVVAVEQIVVG